MAAFEFRFAKSNGQFSVLLQKLLQRLVVQTHFEKFLPVSFLRQMRCKLKLADEAQITILNALDATAHKSRMYIASILSSRKLELKFTPLSYRLDLKNILILVFYD